MGEEASEDTCDSAEAEACHSGESELSLEEIADAKDPDDTLDAAIVIIRNDNGEETEFYMEITPEDYFAKEHAGKIKLVGGMIKKGESPLEGLARELEEEMTDKEAAEIITRNAVFYKKIPGTIFKKGSVFIYEAVIKNHAEWNTIKKSDLTHDAGSKTIVSIKDMPNQLYAFDMGKVLNRYIKERLPQLHNNPIIKLKEYFPKTMYVAA